MSTGYIFEKLDKEKILHIYQLTASTHSWKESLDKIVIYSREFFIFDNIVVYLGELSSKRVDVLYARATGRGKSSEADVAWGELISNRVISYKKTVVEEPTIPKTADRLSSPFMLGVPLFISAELTGALIFVRFGGPPFEDGSLEFAEFLGTQFTSIIRQKTIDEYETELAKALTSSTLQDGFISTVSHELRNPLGFIRGFTTTLLREDASWDAATQREFLEIIDQETNHLTKLIDDLLDASRLQSGTMNYDFQPVHLESIVRDETKRHKYAHPEQHIKLDFHDSLPIIHVDPRRIAQVFDNLLENSHKYAPNADIVIKLYPSGPDVIIEYTDSGPGIEEKYLSMLFTRFFRVPDTKINTLGTGLGLPICKQIISGHNGEINVTSDTGKGLKYTITLPINQ